MRRFCIFIILSISLSACWLTEKKTNFFIGENFSFSIDTNFFQVIDTSRNTFLNINNYIFKYNLDDKNHITFFTLQEKLGVSCSDSLIKVYIDELIKKIENSKIKDSINIELSEVKKANDFHYFIMKGGLKSKPKEVGNSLWAFKCFDKIVMKINCFSGEKSMIENKDLEKAFKEFSKNIKYYNNAEVTKADSIALLGLEPKLKIDYSSILEGRVWIEGEKPVKTIRVSFDTRDKPKTFYPINNKISFSFDENNERLPIGTGYFVIKNSIGKEVKLPFDFSKEVEQYID